MAIFNSYVSSPEGIEIFDDTCPYFPMAFLIDAFFVFQSFLSDGLVDENR